MEEGEKVSYHIIPPNTSVSFFDDTRIYKVDSKHIIGPCDPNCSLDYEHWLEPHIMVREESFVSFPIENIQYIYGNDHRGREPLTSELETYGE